MESPRPNLFVIGASKSGTTYFHNLLRQHPEIFMSRTKEPCYFIRRDQPDHLEEYLTMFRDGADHAWRGESSAAYSETLAFPNVPGDIHSFAPGSRIIYLVRDPFSRFKSLWVQTLSTGHWAEQKFFPMKMPRVYREAVFCYPTFLDGCRYWTNISNFRKHFSDDAIKVILFENFVADVPGTLRDVFAFLGVDTAARIDLDAANQNSRVGKSIYHPWSKRFGRMVPGRIKDMLPPALRLGLRSMVNMLPVPKFDHTDLADEDVRAIRKELITEVRAIYQYAGVENDPWHFFPHSERDGNSAQELAHARQG